MSPYPIMLFDMVKKGTWDKATRLCRFIKVRGGEKFVPVHCDTQEGL